MFQALIIFSLFFKGEILLEPGSFKNISYKNVKSFITTDGDLGFYTPNYVSLFNRRGINIYNQNFINQTVYTFFVNKDHAYISLYNREGVLETKILLIPTGKLIDITEFYSGFSYISDKMFGQPYYPSRVDECLFPPQFELIKEKSNNTNNTQLSFAHITQKQFDLDYTFKSIWPVLVGDHLFLVNEIEPSIQFFNSAILKYGEQANCSRPSKVPTKKLTLQGFKEIKNLFIPPKGMYPFSEIEALSDAWEFSFSRITGFYKYRDGFVVSYLVPVCVAGQCFKHELYILSFDSQFKPVGQPQQQMKGSMMGVWQDQIHIFVPNYEYERSGNVTGMNPSVRIIDDL